MKKLLIAAFVAALAGNTYAAIIDNDVDQLTGGNLQVNGIASLTGVSIGASAVTGTNLINTSTTTHIGTTLIDSNDTTQFTGVNAQVNGIAELSVLNVGPTRVTGTNVINYSEKTLGAAPGVTPFSVINDNDTEQESFFNLQVNGVAQGSVVQLGGIRVNGTNLINTASTTIGSVGAVSAVTGNDTRQVNSDSLQVNGIAEGSLVRVGVARVTGVNSVNSATTTIGSAGFINGVVGNDINQSNESTVQANGILEAQALGLGRSVVNGTNLVNTAALTVGSAGLLNGVINNDIRQVSEDTVQTNEIDSASLLRGGKLKVTGVNSVNSADTFIGEIAVIGGVLGNDIDQESFGADQNNSISVAAVGRAGRLKVDGTNLVNTASLTIGSLAITDLAAGNDIDQLAGATSQNNSILVGQGIGLGTTRLVGVNSINSADTSMVLLSGPSVAFDNDITQRAGGNVQTNVVGMGAVANVGPIRVNGTNSVNSASHSVIQSAP